MSCEGREVSELRNGGWRHAVVGARGLLGRSRRDGPCALPVKKARGCPREEPLVDLRRPSWEVALAFALWREAVLWPRFNLTARC